MCWFVALLLVFGRPVSAENDDATVEVAFTRNGVVQGTPFTDLRGGVGIEP